MSQNPASLRRAFFVLAAIILLMPAAHLPAQQFKLIMGSPIFTDYPKIQIPFEVLDNSATLDTLRPEDFTVLENGVRMIPVEIDCGDLKGAQKISFYFLMDVSFSMAFKEGSTTNDRDSVKWRRAKSVFIEGFNKLRPQDEAALASFAGYRGGMSQFIEEQSFTSDKKRLIDATEGMYLRSGTAIYDAIVNAVNLSSARPGKRVIIMLTDGVDNQSGNTLNQAVSLAWQAGIPVYPIGLGFYTDPNNPGRIDQDTLRKIASGTGGTAFFAPTSEDLSRIFSDIIQSIYSIGCVLSYSTADTCEDGSQRNVEVQANVMGVLLQENFTYTLPDLRSRLQMHVDIPPVLRARDVYAFPLMVDGEVRAGEPMTFRVRLDYDPTHLVFEGVDAGPGVIQAADVRVTEPQPGLLLLDATAAMPSQGIAYGIPAELLTLRFRVLEHDSVALTGMDLNVDYAEQTCEIIPSATPTEFNIHGCPERVRLGFDSTLTTTSGGMLRVPVMLTPGVDFRQFLAYSLTINYDQTMVEFERIDVGGTISAKLDMTISDTPGMLRITTTAGIPSDTSYVLFYAYFKAIETKEALPVQISISDVSVAQSAIQLIGYNCLPEISLFGERMFIDGVCTPLLRLKPNPSLQQNHPNPFNAETQTTRINYTVTGLAPMRLEIVDQFGRLQAVLEEGTKPAGAYTATWTPDGLPSGVYHCILREGDVVKTRNIVFTR